MTLTAWCAAVEARLARGQVRRPDLDATDLATAMRLLRGMEPVVVAMEQIAEGDYHEDDCGGSHYDPCNCETAFAKKCLTVYRATTQREGA